LRQNCNANFNGLAAIKAKLMANGAAVRPTPCATSIIGQTCTCRLTGQQKALFVLQPLQKDRYAGLISLKHPCAVASIKHH
jgi:hypothetical protein